MKQAYLDYYTSHNIIPVHQDISNLEQHFWRRKALYSILGLAPQMFHGKSIAELGPGTGDNAIYIDSLKPSEFYLVDGNPESVREIQAKKEAGRLSSSVVVVQSNIQDFSKEGYFDVVLCEGTVPGQADPKKFLQHVSSLVKVGGVVVFTTQSATSVLADICRRVVKPIIADRYATFPERLNFLTDFFKDDLRLLGGMSRKHEDWVLDQILHPWNDELFSIPKALEAISDRYDFYSSSPRFVTDWRWYKSINESDPGFNKLLLDSYNKQSAWLIDCRSDPDTSLSLDSCYLEELCFEAYWLHIDAWYSDNFNSVEKFLSSLERISDYISQDLPATSKSIISFIEGAMQIKMGNEPTKLHDFRPFFGRGQQYLSFVRRE